MDSVLIIVDQKAPAEAMINLRKFGNVLGFSSSGIVYDAISGHPDIFMFQHPSGLVVAPQIPTKTLEIIKKTGVRCTIGTKPLGSKYPHTSPYNALYTEYGVLHNHKVSDDCVKASHPEFLDCQQGYVRCNSIQVGQTIITSDIGILKILTNLGISALIADPTGIVLPGFKNGFFGGCCGILGNTLFVCGSFKYYQSRSSILNVLEKNNMKLIELYQGPLVDIGGIFFIPEISVNQ